MGIKLTQNSNAVSAEMHDGIITYVVGSQTFKIEIPQVRSLSFPLQCTHFFGDNCMCILANEEHCLLLRWDGTGVVYKKKDKILCLNFLYKYEPCGFLFRRNGGAVLLENSNKYYNVDLFTNNWQDIVMSIVGQPFSLKFTAEDNPLYIAEINFVVRDGYPELRCAKGNVAKVASIGAGIYNIVGELVVSTGFVDLM